MDDAHDGLLERDGGGLQLLVPDLPELSAHLGVVLPCGLHGQIQEVLLRGRRPTTLLEFPEFWKPR